MSDWGLVVAAVGLVFSAVGLGVVARQIFLERRVRTLEYVTNQFDQLSQKGSREAMARVGKNSVENFLKQNPNEKQKLLEYVYSFNRIGAGVRYGAFDEKTLFSIWSPEWFVDKWEDFESLISQERERPGASKSYANFEWLAKVKCPKLKGKYPPP